MRGGVLRGVVDDQRNHGIPLDLLGHCVDDGPDVLCLVEGRHDHHDPLARREILGLFAIERLQGQGLDE